MHILTNFLTFIIYIDGIFLQNVMLLGDCFKIYGHFGMERWTKNKILLKSKSLKTEYAIKLRDLLCFYSNFNKTLILIVEIC